MLSGVTGYRYGYIECCECFRNSGEMANKALKNLNALCNKKTGRRRSDHSVALQREENQRSPV
ncbi:hypothetical protein CRG95_11340 [Escherichia sp. E4208]|nr:hypothetical protein CRG95_11340 [Escherichia sp. E4208]TGB99441.1 hypothetical protein CRG92_15755 [Escherichia sp. E2586]TGC00451.1 hypothetical protein CRI63_18465 [Escherichia sp. E2661]